MAKRGADFQITREGTENGGSDNEDQAGNAVRALAEVMALRKILKPRGRLGGANGATKPTSKLPLPSAPASSDNQTKLRALNEQFIATITKANQPGTVASFAEACEKYIEYYKQINGKVATIPLKPPAVAFQPPAQPVAPVSQPALIPAKPVVSSDEKPNPFAFLKKLAPESSTAPSLFSFGTTTAPTFTLAPTAAPVTKLVPASVAKPVEVPKPAPKPTAPEPIEIDSDSDLEDDKVPIQGPTFTMATVPTKKKLAFSFNRPPKQKDDSDLDSEIEIKGPTFEFNAASAPTTLKPVFKFATTETPKVDKPKDVTPKEDNNKQDKPSFLFGKPVETKSTDAEKPTGFLFGNTTAKVTPSFQFGNTGDKPALGFQLGKSMDTTEPPATEKKVPSFLFGKPEDAPAKPKAFNLSEKPSLGFSFAKPAEATSEKPAEDKETTTKPALAFSFGKPSEASKPSLAFGFGKKDDDKPQDKPASAFNFAKKDEKSDDKPAATFGFGKKDDDKPAAPAFNFGKKDDKPAPSFNFGKKDDTGDKPPSFNFGKADASSDKSASFSFGKTTDAKSDGKPAFSFGKSDNPFGSLNSNTFGSDLANSFNFSKPDASGDKPVFSFNNAAEKLAGGAFSFSFNKPTESAVAAPTTTNASLELATGEEVEGAELSATFTPVVKLTNEVDVLTGEETEDVVYTKRVKLFVVTDRYESKGLGELKVLKNKQTNKGRILIRADGGLRVLLNCGVSKDITYTAIGDGKNVRIPVFEDAGITTYMVKVKTAEDGNNLLKAINDVK